MPHVHARELRALPAVTEYRKMGLPQSRRCPDGDDDWQPG